jgi:hypothetical protein
MAPGSSPLSTYGCSASRAKFVLESMTFFCAEAERQNDIARRKRSFFISLTVVLVMLYFYAKIQNYSMPPPSNQGIFRETRQKSNEFFPP